MSVIVKIGIVSLIYIVFALLLKSYRPEYVFLLRVFCVLLIVLLISDYISSFLTEIISVFAIFNIESVHVSLLFKVVAITIVGEIISDSLNDVGESSVSGVVILITKFIVLFLTIPLINTLLIFCLKFIE